MNKENKIEKLRLNKTTYTNWAKKSNQIYNERAKLNRQSDDYSEQVYKTLCTACENRILFKLTQHRFTEKMYRKLIEIECTLDDFEEVQK